MSAGRKRTKRTPWFGFEHQPNKSRPGWYEIRERGKPARGIWWNGDQWRLSNFSEYRLSVVYAIFQRLQWRGLAEKPE